MVMYGNVYNVAVHYFVFLFYHNYGAQNEFKTRLFIFVYTALSFSVYNLNVPNIQMIKMSKNVFTVRHVKKIVTK